MEKRRENPDDAEHGPGTHALGNHPVGTAAGAAAGGVAAAAAAATAAAGPVGTVVGAVVGAVAGGVVGKGLADLVEEPHPHDVFWRDSFATRPYVRPGSHFDDYAPAYRYGRACVERYAGRSFDDAEAEIRKDWERARGASQLDWDDARHPVRDAWEWVKTDIDHD